MNLSFNNKVTIKDSIKKLIEYTSNYEKKEVREVSIAKWL